MDVATLRVRLQGDARQLLSTISSSGRSMASFAAAADGQSVVVFEGDIGDLQAAQKAAQKEMSLFQKASSTSREVLFEGDTSGLSSATKAGIREVNGFKSTADKAATVNLDADSAGISAGTRSGLREIFSFKRNADRSRTVNLEADTSGVSSGTSAATGLISRWKGTADRQATVNLDADTSGLQSGVAAANRELSSLESNTSRVKLALAGLVAGGVGFAAGATAAKEFGWAILGMSSYLEQAEIAFGSMLGSGEQARAFLEDLAEFAETTPFEFPELVAASRRLLAFGFDAKSILPIMTDIGNTAAAMGAGSEGVDRITYALGQMSAATVVQAGELNQLTEMGIPAYDILAKKVGVSAAAIKEMTSQGEISSDVFISAFREFSQANYGDMMAAQSKTAAGAWSTIKDAVMLTTVSAIKPFFTVLTSVARLVAALVSGSGLGSFFLSIAAAVQHAASQVGHFIDAIAFIINKSSLAKESLGELGPTARAAATAIGNGFRSAASATSSFFKNVWTLGKAFAQAVVEGENLSDFTTHLPKSWQANARAALTFTRDLRGVAIAAIDAARGQEQMGRALRNSSPAWQTAGRQVFEFVKDLRTFASNALQRGRAIGEGVWKGVSEGFKSAMPSIPIAGPVQKFFAKIATAFKSGWERAKQWANQAKPVGGSMIDGLRAGAAEKAKQWTTAIINFVKNGINAIKEYLQVSSPSGLTKGIGISVVLGLIAGLFSMRTMLINAAVMVAQTVYEAIKGFFTDNPIVDAMAPPQLPSMPGGGMVPFGAQGGTEQAPLGAHSVPEDRSISYHIPEDYGFKKEVETAIAEWEKALGGAVTFDPYQGKAPPSMGADLQFQTLPSGETSNYQNRAGLSDLINMEASQYKHKETATHEIGHALGLRDMYEAQNAEQFRGQLMGGQTDEEMARGAYPAGGHIDPATLGEAREIWGHGQMPGGAQYGVQPAEFAPGASGETTETPTLMQSVFTKVQDIVGNIWQTIKDFGTGVWDALKPAWDAFTQGFDGMGSVVQPLVDIFRNLLWPAIQDFLLGLKSMAPILTPIAGFLGGVLRGAFEALIPLIALLAAAIRAVAWVFGHVLGPAIGWVGEKLTPLTPIFQTVGRVIGWVFGTLITGAAGAFVKGFGLVLSLLGKGASGFTRVAAMIDTFGRVQMWVVPLATRFGAVIGKIPIIGPLIGRAMQLAGSALQFIGDVLIKVSGAAGWFATQIAKLIGGIVSRVPILGKIWATISSTITKAFSGIWNTLASDFGSIVRGFTQIFPRIGSLISKGIGIVKSVLTRVFGDDIISGVGEGLSKAWSWLVKRWQNFWRDLVGPNVIDHRQWMRTGQMVVEGVTSGVANASKTAWQKVVQFFSGLVAAVAQFLGIASPSTRFMTVGKMIVLGLISGIRTAITGLPAAIIKGATALIRAAMGIGKKVGQALFQALKSISPQAAAAVKQFAQNAIKGFMILVTAVKKNMQIVRMAISAAWTIIKRTTQVVWSGIKSFFSGVWKIIKGIFTGNTKMIKAGISQAWRAIQMITKAVWNAIRALFNVFWQAAKLIFKNSLATIKLAVSNVWNSIKQGTSTVWNGIKTFLGNTWETMKTNFTTFKENLLGVAKSIAEGLRGWFDQAAQWVGDKLEGLKTTVTNILKGIAGIVANVLEAFGANDLAGKIRGAISGGGNGGGGGAPESGINRPGAYTGAYVTRRQTLDVAERGPEYIINPKRRDNAGLIEAAAQDYNRKHRGGWGESRRAFGHAYGHDRTASGGGTPGGMAHHNVTQAVRSAAERIASATGTYWNTYPGHGTPGGSNEQSSADFWGGPAVGTPIGSAGGRPAELGITGSPPLLYAIAQGRYWRGGQWQDWSHDPHWDHDHLSWIPGGGALSGAGGLSLGPSLADQIWLGKGRAPESLAGKIGKGIGSAVLNFLPGGNLLRAAGDAWPGLVKVLPDTLGNMGSGVVAQGIENTIGQDYKGHIHDFIYAKLGGTTTGGGKSPAGLTAGDVVRQGGWGSQSGTAVGVMGAESSFNARAQNPSGARGLFQIMPTTASGLGIDYGKLYDPLYNSQAGKKVWNAQGWGAWVAHSSGAYRQFLGQENARITGYAKGGVGPNPHYVTNDTLVNYGEELRTGEREYFIPTGKRHHRRATRLWAAAGQDLGVLDMAAGGYSDMIEQARRAWPVDKQATVTFGTLPAGVMGQSGIGGTRILLNKLLFPKASSNAQLSALTHEWGHIGGTGTHLPPGNVMHTPVQMQGSTNPTNPTAADYRAMGMNPSDPGRGDLQTSGTESAPTGGGRYGSSSGSAPRGVRPTAQGGESGGYAAIPGGPSAQGGQGGGASTSGVSSPQVDQSQTSQGAGEGSSEQTNKELREIKGILKRMPVQFGQEAREAGAANLARGKQHHAALRIALGRVDQLKRAGGMRLNRRWG